MLAYRHTQLPSLDDADVLLVLEEEAEDFKHVESASQLIMAIVGQAELKTRDGFKVCVVCCMPATYYLLPTVSSS